MFAPACQRDQTEQATAEQPSRGGQWDGHDLEVVRERGPVASAKIEREMDTDVAIHSPGRQWTVADGAQAANATRRAWTAGAVEGGKRHYIDPVDSSGPVDVSQGNQTAVI